MIIDTPYLPPATAEIVQYIEEVQLAPQQHAETYFYLQHPQFAMEADKKAHPITYHSRGLVK